MKNRLFVSAFLFLSIGLFSSCNSEGVDGDTANYWNSNSLIRMQLRGSVHTMTKTIGQTTTVYTFNSDGNLTSEAVSGGAIPSYTTSYVYENGRLISQNSGDFLTAFEYNNAGKYVPRMPYHICQTGLVPSLSAVITVYLRVDYVFHGTDLWMVSSSQGIPTDTMVFQYTGNYPTSITTYSVGSNINTISMSYAPNGMFKTYTEHYAGANYEENRVISFKTDDLYQLEDNWVTSTTDELGKHSSTNTYLYNAHKDPTNVTSSSSVTEWSDYVYDATGNWTSRKVRYSYPNEIGTLIWGDYQTETRSFLYF